MKIIVVQNIIGLDLGKCDEGRKLDNFMPMSYQDFLEKYDDFLLDTSDLRKLLESRKKDKQNVGFLFVKEITNVIKKEKNF